MAIRLTGDTAPGKASPAVQPSTEVCQPALPQCTYAQLRTYVTAAAFCLAYEAPSSVSDSDLDRMCAVRAAAERRPEAHLAERQRLEWSLAAALKRDNRPRDWVVAEHPHDNGEPFWSTPLLAFTPADAYQVFAGLACARKNPANRLTLKEYA